MFNDVMQPLPAASCDSIHYYVYNFKAYISSMACIWQQLDFNQAPVCSCGYSYLTVVTVGLPAASNDIVIHAILKGWISCTGVMVHINVMCTDKVN